MPVITCIDDLKRLHQPRTPRMFFDYCESGSYTEQTFRENTSDFASCACARRSRAT
jgi:L-lactate dehydrogenase (cytochrome)